MGSQISIKPYHWLGWWLLTIVNTLTNVLFFKSFHVLDFRQNSSNSRPVEPGLWVSKPNRRSTIALMPAPARSKTSKQKVPQLLTIRFFTSDNNTPPSAEVLHVKFETDFAILMYNCTLEYSRCQLLGAAKRLFRLMEEILHHLGCKKTFE